MKHAFFIILVFLKIVIFNAHAEKSVKDINNIRMRLIDITRQIMQLECEINESNKANLLLTNQEKNAVSTILDQKKIGMTLQNLRHVQGSSPLLMAITSHSVDDLVKIIILLKVLEPQLNIKYNKSLSQLKTVSMNRSQIKENTQNFEKKKEKASELEGELEELLTQKYHLFFNTSHNPNLEKFAKEHRKTDGSKDSSQNFDDLVHQLQTLFTSETAKSIQKMTLLLPVNGVLSANSTQSNNTQQQSNNTQQQSNNAQQMQQDLSLSFETYANAHVISPIKGSIVFTGFLPSFGQVVILKQDDFFCVMTGLGAVHCFLGDTLLPGEPIGRMPPADKSIRTFKLRMELHKGGQHLDPRPYLSAVAST
ncbi:MAG: hypothetical protein V4544_06745 [Pseudomonadota bacterium]